MPEHPAPTLIREGATLTWLWGARVQRVDSPRAGLFVITLYDHGQKSSLLLSVHAEQLGVGLLTERPIGLPASAFVRRLRVAIENAALLSAHWLAGANDSHFGYALELSFSRKDTATTLVADFHSREPNLFFLDPVTLRVTGAADERARRARFGAFTTPYTPPSRSRLTKPADQEAWLAAGRALCASDQRSADDTLRNDARARARAQLKRTERRINAISGDLARAMEAPTLRRDANLLLCHLQDVPAHAERVHLNDETIEPPAIVEISLDPAISLQQNIERKFVRARRLERGIPIAEQRLREAQDEAQRLREFLASLDESSPETLVHTAKSLRLSPPSNAALPPAKKQRPTRIPYRTFESQLGTLILVGKGAADNDTLTLTVARPHDVWLHARGVSGAHVVVPKERNAELPPELLLDAAHLAAHFSDARNEAVTEVQHTERRYLRKPKGSPPGAVRVDRERVVVLRVEPERLKRLLSQEHPSQ